MLWIDGYGGKMEFILDPSNVGKGLSSLQWPWEITTGVTFSIDTSLIEDKDETEKHIRVTNFH